MHFFRIIRLILPGASLVCLLGGLLPIGRWRISSLLVSSASHDLGYLQAALVLSAIGLALFAVVSRRIRTENLEHFLLQVLIACLIVHASCALVQFWKFLSHQIPDTWSEQIIYLSAMRAEGLSEMYARTNLVEPPFNVSIYPPLYYLLLHWGLALTGGSPTVGRLLGVLPTIVIGVLIGFGCRIAGKVYAWAAGLLFLSIFPTMCWVGGTLAKSDFLGVALAVAGVLVYLERGSQDKRGWLLPASALCGLALLAKQTIFAAPGAIVIDLLLRRRFREVAQFGGLVLLWPLLTYAVLWGPTDGGIWLMTVTANAVRFTPGKILSFGVGRYLNTLFVAAVLAACFLVPDSPPLRSRHRFAVIFFLLALPWFLVSVGRPGSSHHYFLEAAASGCLVIGLGLSAAEAAGARVAQRLLILLILCAMTLQFQSQFEITTRPAENPEERQQIRAALSALGTRPDEYILPNSYYTYDVLQAGHRALVLDTFQFTLMCDNGIVSADSLLEPMRTGKVPYAILENTLDWHAGLPYGGRQLPLRVVEFLRDQYSCSTLFHRRFDSRYLVICEYKPHETERLGPSANPRH